MRRIYHINVLLFVALILSCATPTRPTGGPPDKEGPKIEKTVPETGTINYTDQKFEFHFSEFVNRSTFEKELSIEPDLGIEYEVNWKRKRATVEFKEAFPDSNTIILTVGANTTDMKNNKMGAPIQLAISTGDDIDDGRVYGQIKNAEDGKARAGQKVLLYRSPVDLNNAATYIAETDTGGVFNFGYLREGTYKAIMVDDRNINRTWDRGREKALPFNIEFLELEKGATDTLDVAYWVDADTTRPELQGVGLLSTNRLRLRFSEEVRFTPSTNIQVLDTLGQTYTTAFPLYIPQDEAYIAYAYARNNLNADEVYNIQVEGIMDLSGNEAIADLDPFMGSNQADTVRQDIITFNGENGLYPNQPLVIEYTKPITDPMVNDSTVIVEGEVDFKNWPNVSILDNKLTIPPQENWLEGVDYKFLVWNPGTQRRQLISVDIWDVVDFGSVELNIESADSSESFRVLLFDETNLVDVDTSSTSTLFLDNLPPISYTLVVFADQNGNGIWDAGSVDPFIKPEPFYIQNALNVQKGFTSDVSIDFR